jgi:phosphoribosylformylglycinamidine cyclo-ligase
VSTYESAGVDYRVLDAAKRSSLRAALSTTSYPASRGAEVVDASRGEPAVVVRLGGVAGAGGAGGAGVVAGAGGVGGVTTALVLECLGTKSVIASEYEAAGGAGRFDAVGYDTVAAAVNDVICVGALPVLVNAYFATGSAAWYGRDRHEQLVGGFARGCADAGAAWGGGESPTLSGLVAEDGIDLAATALGIIPAELGGDPLLGAALAVGDEIVLVASTGLHANGASLARRVAAELAEGWRTPLPGSGRELGDVVLDASAIYVSLVAALIADHVPLRYVSHITGHGLRKLMRADRELGYRIHSLPEVPEVLAYLAGATGMDSAEAYGTFNMGAGLAVYCAAGSGSAVVASAQSLGHAALLAGVVEDGPRRVMLEPVGVTYEAADLELR